MAKWERRRTLRSVTLDDDLVDQAKEAGLKLLPKITTLSGVIDYALADFVRKVGVTPPPPARRRRKQ